LFFFSPSSRLSFFFSFWTLSCSADSGAGTSTAADIGVEGAVGGAGAGGVGAAGSRTVGAGTEAEADSEEGVINAFFSFFLKDSFLLSTAGASSKVNCIKSKAGANGAAAVRMKS